MQGVSESGDMFEYNFHWRPVFRSLPDLFEAGLITLQVATFAMVTGIVLGLALAAIRLNMRGPVCWFATTWIELARNTPALFQLFFFGFGIGAFGIHLTPYMIVFVGLTFNSAGYLAENFRGGFRAIPVTQLHAARSLGMTQWQVYTRILVPQVLRIVYYPMTNQFVWVVLMSSLGMLVGLRELSGETQFFASKTYRIFEYFAVTAIIYYVMVKVILIIARLLASRLFRY
jgi:polar amino acid transport system permease protein